MGTVPAMSATPPASIAERAARLVESWPEFTAEQVEGLRRTFAPVLALRAAAASSSEPGPYEALSPAA